MAGSRSIEYGHAGHHHRWMDAVRQRDLPDVEMDVTVTG